MLGANPSSRVAQLDKQRQKEMAETLAIYLYNMFIDHVCLGACSCFSSHKVLAWSHRHPYAVTRVVCVYPCD